MHSSNVKIELCAFREWLPAPATRLNGAKKLSSISQSSLKDSVFVVFFLKLCVAVIHVLFQVACCLERRSMPWTATNGTWITRSCLCFHILVLVLVFPLVLGGPEEIYFALVQRLLASG